MFSDPDRSEGLSLIILADSEMFMYVQKLKFILHEYKYLQAFKHIKNFKDRESAAYDKIFLDFMTKK